MSLQAVDALVVVGRDADAEDALCFASPHGKQTVRGTAPEGLLPVEIVGEFGSLVSVGLGLDDLGGDDGLTAEGTPELLAAALVLADGLGDDVLSAFEGDGDGGDGGGDDEALGCSLWVALSLKEENMGQWLKTLFPGHLGTCAPLGLVGEIDILQFVGIPAVGNALLQFGRHLVEVGDGLCDGLFPFLYFLQSLVVVADGGNQHLVESAGALLTVAGDERDGASLVEQCEGIGNGSLLERKSLSNKCCKYILFHIYG